MDEGPRYEESQYLMSMVRSLKLQKPVNTAIEIKESVLSRKEWLTEIKRDELWKVTFGLIGTGFYQ